MYSQPLAYFCSHNSLSLLLLYRFMLLLLLPFAFYPQSWSSSVVSSSVVSPVQCGGKVCQSFTPVSWSLFLTSPMWPQGVSDLFSSPVQCGGKVCQSFTPVSWSLFLTSPMWRHGVSERRGTGREQLHLSLQGPSHRGHVWSVSLL